MWLNWDQLDLLLKDREVALFGSGEWAEKTLRKIPKQPLFILDNSNIMQKSKLGGIDIVPPSKIKSAPKNTLILITTGSYDSVITQLEEMGYEACKDFFCTPSLRNQRVEGDIKQNDQSILLTSADIPNEKSQSKGGGLYRYHFKSKHFEKLISGKFHEFVYVNNIIHEPKYFILDEFHGPQVYNAKFKLVDSYEGLPGSIMHGLSYDPKNNFLFIGNTGRDSISIIDANNGKHIDEIFISRKNKEGEADRHHLNDVCFYQGDLYVSMFSISGLWREGCYDGGVVKIDLSTKSIVAQPISGQWMPHSICFINGEITFIDSMRGDVYKTSNKKLVNISGFTRGIDYDGRYYYIGQSEHRYFDRLKGINDNIEVNCGIHVFDDSHKISRFYSLNDIITNIHSIMIDPKSL